MTGRRASPLVIIGAGSLSAALLRHAVEVMGKHGVGIAVANRAPINSLPIAGPGVVVFESLVTAPVDPCFLGSLTTDAPRAVPFLPRVGHPARAWALRAVLARDAHRSAVRAASLDHRRLPSGRAGGNKRRREGRRRG